MTYVLETLCLAARNIRVSAQRSLVVLSLLFLASYAFSQSSYYVSASGNDANDGKSQQTPWRTIDKLNTVALNSGDVIYFQRGDVFPGQIVLKQSGSLTLGAYGTSTQKPVISGAVRLSGWTLYRGSIYSAAAPQLVKNLFANGTQMTLARYPNSGFLPIEGTNGSSTITSSALTQSSGYWNGANVRLRVNAFSFESHPVSSFTGTTLTLGTPNLRTFKTGYGFYLDNKLEELDAPGEWYCDPTTNTVYFYAPSGADPNQLDVEGTVFNYGVQTASGQNNTTIHDLSFKYQAAASVYLSGTTNSNTIASNDFFGGLVNGIQVDGTTTNCTIDNNSIRQYNGCGVVLANAIQSTVSNNTIENIGLVQGYGVSGLGMQGIYLLAGNNNKIQRNSLDSIGYHGIRSDGSYNLVENNVVTNTMMKLADGGAIYCYGGNPSVAYRSTFRNNIVENVWGDTAGCPVPTYKSAVGIYLDNSSTGIRVEGNTIVRGGSMGVFINSDAYRDTVCGNLLYDCGRNPGGNFLHVFLDTTKTHYGENLIVGNVFYAPDSTKTLIHIQEWAYHPVGRIDSNYYCTAPKPGTPFQTLTYTTKWSATNYTLAQWQSMTGQDMHSTLIDPQPKDSTFVNASASQVVENLGSLGYRDVNSNPVTGSVAVAPYSYTVLFYDPSVVMTSTPSAARENPEQFALYQNTPNPFNPSTVIAYHLPNETRVRLEVYDTVGHLVAVLVDGVQPAGDHRIVFENPNLASGIYFYQLQAGAFTRTRKMLLLK